MSLKTAQKVVHHADDVSEYVSLDYAARFIRRKVVTTQSGVQVLVDLPKTVSLEAGDALQTEAGDLIGVLAAPEPLLEVKGHGLHRIAWHIGNRHAPCQIESHRLLIQSDHVMARMLEQLGAHVHEVLEPFTPEGGAYGHGRTHGHDHGHQHGPEGAHTHEH